MSKPTLAQLAHEILLAYREGWALGIRDLTAGDGNRFCFLRRFGIGHGGPAKHLDTRAVQLLLDDGFLELDRTNAGGTRIYRIADRFQREAADEDRLVFRVDPSLANELLEGPRFELRHPVALTAPLAAAAIDHKRRGTVQARIFRAKTCACGATFTPSGPRSAQCDRCRTATRSAVVSASRARERGPSRSPTASGRPRTYREKPCRACGQTFQPTGPRAQYCGRPGCRIAIARSA